MDTLSLITFFMLNVFSNILGGIKTIYTVKGSKTKLFIITILDSFFYVYVFRLVTSDNTVLGAILFALSKAVGLHLAVIYTKHKNEGIKRITIYAKPNKAIEIADLLRDKDFSTTTTKGYGMNGMDRFKVEIILNTKRIAELRTTLQEEGYSNLTSIVEDVDKVEGKLLI